MASSIEIERKYLVLERPSAKPDKIHKIRQGYIAREDGNSVRIREKNGKYILSIKTAHHSGGRHELEYVVSEEEGEILFSSITHKEIIKTREIYYIGTDIWEVDIFDGANKGLIVAEIELKSYDQQIDLPSWVGPEVTDLSKFYNANLAYNPFDNWRIRYPDLINRLMG